MRYALKYFSALSVLLFAVALLSAAPTARGSHGFKVRTITTSSTDSVYGNDPVALSALGMSHYTQVCWKRMDAAVSEFTYVANADESENDLLGWAGVGTEKECYDWDQGVKLYFWHTLLEGPKTIKLIFIE